MTRQRILITGAAGRIGSLLAQNWREQYDLVLTDKLSDKSTMGVTASASTPAPAPAPAPAPVQPVDLADFDAMRPLFDDIDTVVHLAADPDPRARWDSLLPNNVIATYNVLEAAASAGCQRVIVASSVHAVVGYPADVQVKTTMPVAPANLYGAAKAFGEALGRYYADHRGLSVFCLRLGTVLEEHDKRLEAGHVLLDLVLTRGDLLKLYDACLSTGHVRFGIFHGISDNRYKRLDLSDTKSVLNYAPADDAFVLTGMLSPGRPDHLFESR